MNPTSPPNPYEAVHDPYEAVHEINATRRSWISVFWDGLLLLIFLYCCVSEYPRFRFLAQMLSFGLEDEVTFLVGQMALEAHLLLATGLILLALSTFFCDVGGFAWRSLYVFTSIAFIVDDFPMRPTSGRIGLVIAYAMVVCPVIVSGLGWVAVSQLCWRRIRAIWSRKFISAT